MDISFPEHIFFISSKLERACSLLSHPATNNKIKQIARSAAGLENVSMSISPVFMLLSPSGNGLFKALGAFRYQPHQKISLFSLNDTALVVSEYFTPRTLINRPCSRFALCDDAGGAVVITPGFF